MKRILFTGLMLVAVLIVGVTGTRSAYAEGAATANLGVTVTFDNPIIIVGTNDLKFRLTRDVSKNGHYTNLGDLPFPIDSSSPTYLPGGIQLLGPPHNIRMWMSMSPVSLTDGLGHTATLHLKAHVWSVEDTSTATDFTDSAPASILVNFTTGYWGTGFPGAQLPDGGLAFYSQVLVSSKPDTLDFAPGSDVLGNWTGTATFTFDYTD